MKLLKIEKSLSFTESRFISFLNIHNIKYDIVSYSDNLKIQINTKEDFIRLKEVVNSFSFKDILEYTSVIVDNNSNKIIVKNSGEEIHIFYKKSAGEIIKNFKEKIFHLL